MPRSSGGWRKSRVSCRRSPTCRRAARSRHAVRTRSTSAGASSRPTRRSGPATGPHAGAAEKSTEPVMPDTGRLVLEVKDLKKHFPIKKGLLRRTAGHVYAVDGVSLSIRAGQTLALVGESGCGKSTVGRTILRLIEPTAGRIRINGTDVTHLKKAELRPYRRQMQIIFQDPFSSLDPRMSAGDIAGEPLRVHGVGSAKEPRARVAHKFKRVGPRAEA